jgi:Cu(I)/Ag(I) efflux system membrane protein CusA/SilA
MNGMVSSTLLTLIVIAAIYGLVKGWAPPSKVISDDGRSSEQVMAKITPE